MARFESSRKRKSKRNSKDSYSKRNNRGRRDSGRKSNNRNRRNFEMTKVICSSCGVECKVPFKPTSTKPVYCDACFVKKNKVSSNKIPNKDFDIINEKLDKIMKALDIE